MTDQPRVGIILIHITGAAHHTRRCLESLRESTYKNVEIIVVDNGSQDGSGAQIRNEFPQITYLRSETNEGFTGGNNTGIDLAIGHGVKHILLLNNDAIVTPSFLEPLVERMEQNPGTIGAISGKIYLYPPAANGKDKMFWCAGTRQRWYMGYAHIGEGEEDHGQYDEACKTPYASGCLMLMNGGVVRQIGGLSNEYFMYWEESDWCMRAAALGFSSWYEPRSVIYHNFHSAEKGKETPFYMYMLYRNAFIYAKRHFHGARRLRFVLFFPIHIVNRLRLLVLARNTPGAKKLLQGIRDYFKGYTGKRGLQEKALLK